MLARLLKKKRFHQKGKYTALSAAWHRVMTDILGEEIAAQTRDFVDDLD